MLWCCAGSGSARCRSDFERWYFESWHKYPLKKSAIQRNYYEVLQWAARNSAISLRGRSKLALDVGCAHGYAAGLLQRLGYEAYGCDLSSLYVRSYAKSVMENLLLCDAQNIPFRRNCFDLVVAFELIEHLPRKAEFLQSCYAALKPNGTLVMTTPLGMNVLDLNCLRVKLLTKLLLGTTNVEGHVKEFRSAGEIRRALESTGFHVIKVELWWFAPIPLRLLRRYVTVRVPTFVVPHFRCVAVKS